jgi:hypothetical protein
VVGFTAIAGAATAQRSGLGVYGLSSTATRMVFELHGRRDPDYRGWSKAISNHTMQIIFSLLKYIMHLHLHITIG